MTTPLRELFALFDVNTGSAETKLTRLSTTTDLAKKALAELAMTAITAFSAHAVIGFVEEMIDLGSVLNDTSDKLGVGTDELQKFQFAAQLTGVDAEEAAKALGFLNRNVGEALDGSKEAVQSFAELGVQLKDGHGDVRELGDLLPEVADAFQKMGSQQERTAAAMKLFGRSGASLLPLLKDGGAKLAEMNEQFEALGLGIEEDFIHKADDAGDAIDILKLGFRALKTRVAVEVLPGITNLAKKFSSWVLWAQKVTRETNIVKEAWTGLAILAALAAGKVFAGWAKVIGLFPKEGSLVEKLFAMGEMGLIIGALLLLGLAVEDIVTMCEGGESVIGDFLDEFLGVEEKQELIDSLTQSFNDLLPAIEDLGPALTEFAKIAAQVLPLFIAMVADAIKAVLSLATFIVGLGEYVATIATEGLDAGDKVAAEQYKKQAAIWKSGLTTEKVFNGPDASVPATSVRQPIAMTRGDQNIEINVKGGPSNEDTGRAVGGAVRSVLSDADRRAAAHTLFRGPQGGDDDG